VSTAPPALDAAKGGQTGRTLLWTALVLLLVGGAVGAPEAGVACAALAALCALPALVSGAKRFRIIAVAILIAAAALAGALLPRRAGRPGALPGPRATPAAGGCTGGDPATVNQGLPKRPRSASMTFASARREKSSTGEYPRRQASRRASAMSATVRATLGQPFSAH
jgi:hypothetical protein